MVKSITIHNLDTTLEALIEERARAEGLSLNNTVKKLLCQALGLNPGGNGGAKADFAEFSGRWTEADRQQFEKRAGALRRVDPQDWQ